MDDKKRHRTRLSAAERRETILRAATEVFAQHGYRASKVSDVAALVGVTEPVIFQNFGAKAALFAAVLERAAADARSSMHDFGSAAVLLNHVLTGGGGADEGDHTGTAYGVLFADAVALTAEPELAGPAQRAFGAVATHLADVVRRAQAAGDAGPGIDPEAAAWLLLSLLSARRLRDAAMPAGLEPAVTALALRALRPLTGPRIRRHRARIRYSSSAAASAGTSTEYCLSTASGTISSARSCVDASTTGAAAPSWCARSQFTAVTHHLSPGTSPGNLNCGIGVDRSLPMFRWCSRNSAVTTAQMVWLPRSSGLVVQHPSR
jgi:AcrR family transcriptional regulator